jgi:DnaJ-class molecular chaperone
MAKRDFYEVLGISKNATKDEIKKAYKRLAKKHHPDVDKSAGAEQKFKEINEAYQILSDPQKKAAYDRLGHAAFDPSAGSGFGGRAGQSQSGQWGPFTYTYTSTGGGEPFDFGGYADPFDIFEEVFGFRGFGGRARRGRDLHYSITIEFIDAVKGLEQEIKIGSRRLKIKIPQGIRDGARLKFAGEGEPGPQGTPPGDLFLTVRIQPHPVFQRIGDDIIVGAEISFVQAALGDTIQVPAIDPSSRDGQTWVKLKIPAGTQPGTSFRLRGKGVPHRRGWGRGDAYVRVKVKIPQKLSRKQKSLLEEFRNL